MTEPEEPRGNTTPDTAPFDGTVATFDQYKLYWEALDRLVQRRSTTNNFALAVNSALLSLAGLAETSFVGGGVALVSTAGFMVSLVWAFQIFSNRQLLRAKYKVLHELETQLDMNLFRREWELISDQQGRQIWPVAYFEQFFPAIFMAIFALLLITGGVAS